MLSNLLQKVESAKDIAKKSYVRDLITQVEQYIELHYAEPLSIDSLAELFRLSPNYLNKIFSKYLGMGIHAYLLNYRLKIAVKLLRDNNLMVKEVAYRVGFSDPLYFSRLYKKRFGSSPSTLQKK